MFCMERPCNVLSNCHKILMIYPSCCCFPKYSSNNEQGNKSSQNLAEWCNMFKYVNCWSGSLNDLKEACKKKSNGTLTCHAARVLLSILVHLGWSAVPVGCPWLVRSALLSISQKATLSQRPCQLMALESPWSTGWLGAWFMLLNSSLVLVRAPEAEVIYLCPEPSCIQQHSAWPHMRKHPRLPVQDAAVVGSTGDCLAWTCARRNRPKAINTSAIHPHFPGRAGRELAGGPSGWVTHAAPSHGHASSCQSAL